MVPVVPVAGVEQLRDLEVVAGAGLSLQGVECAHEWNISDGDEDGKTLDMVNYV